MRFNFRKKHRNLKTPEEQIHKERPLRFAEIQDKKRKRQRAIKLMIFVLIVFLAISVIIFLNSFFRVKRVICEVENETCNDVLNQSSQSLLGKSMFSRLSLSHAFLQVHTKRVWPNGIRVQFAKPELLLTLTPSKDGIAPYSITKSGIVVSFVATDMYMPPIYDLELETKSIGDRVDSKRFSFYQSLIASLSKLSMLQITSITMVNDNEMHIALPEASAIASIYSIEQELQSLQAILMSPTLDWRGKTIDLRFENPVLK